MIKGILLIIVGFAAAAYGILVLSIIGAGELFSFFYLAVGLILITAGVILFRKKKDEEEEGGFLHGLIVAVSAFLILAFVIIEAAIVVYPLFSPSAGADYAILLGTQYRDDGPSVEYRARLMAAYEYLTENPDTILVATGGKGENEPVSEAEGAKEFLVAMGIDEERILTENYSTNTYTNLEYAYKLITDREGDDRPGPIVIVSSNFHLLRARMDAKKVGFRKVSGKGSQGNKYLLPHYYTREFFAFIKDLLFSGKK